MLPLSSIVKPSLDKFNKLAGKFPSLLEKANSLNNNEYILPFWQNINNTLSKDYNPPPFDFLKHGLIGHTMFSINEGWAKQQLGILEQLYPKNVLKQYLKEEQVGDPLIFSEEYLASCNSIHHLYHFTQFAQNSNQSNIKYILEFGGGYGKLVTLLDKLYDINTYTIIDIPYFSCLQWLYLSCIFGEENINLILDDSFKFNKINLIPIGLVRTYLEQLRYPSLFVAMWSLSESNDKSFNIIAGTEFFNSRKIFLGYHSNMCKDLPIGNKLHNFVKDKYKTQPFGYVNEHYYCWR